MNRLFTLLVLVLISTGLTACAPEVGSDEWCKQMEEKPKGDWTAKEAANYAKYCLLK